MGDKGDIHLRAPLLKAGKQRRQPAGGGRLHRAQTQTAAWGCRMQSLLCLFRQAQDPPGIAEKLHACRGQHHFFVAANEELNGKLLFQLLNAGRDIGLCAAQPFCCLGDALRFCHLNEDLECAVVHIFLLNTIIMLILPSLKEMVSLQHR